MLAPRGRRRARTALALAAAMTSLALLTACGVSGDPGEAEPDAEEITPISATMVMSVPAILSFPIEYYAAFGGFFEDEGLDVAVEPVQGGGQAIQSLATGVGQFAVANLSAGVEAVSRGVDVVGVYNRTSAPVFTPVALQSSDIRDLDDLRGKVIGVASVSSAGNGDLKAMLAFAGIDESDVEIKAMGSTGTATSALLQNDVDAYMGQGSELLIFDREGIEYRDLTPKGFPYNSVGPVWVTKEFQETNSEAIARFGRGMASAGAALLADPDTAFELLCSNAPAECGDLEHARRTFDASVERNLPKDDKWGYTDIDGVSSFLDLYLQAGLVGEEWTDASLFITNEFVDTFNG